MDSPPKLLDQLTIGLNQMLGLPCKEIVGGVAIGSMVYFEFGANLGLKTLQRSNGQSVAITEFECEVWVENASWRLEQAGMVICTSKTLNGAGSELDVGIHKIVGKNLLRAEVSAIGFDLMLAFEGELIFRIFCDYWDDENEFSNYQVKCANGTFIVGPRSILTIGP